MALERGSEGSYTPPTTEDLNWQGLKTSQKRDLLEHWNPIQRQGIELGIRPQRPTGITTNRDLLGLWQREVWNLWLKKQGIDPDRYHFYQGRELHTNPDQRAQTRRVTLKPDLYKRTR